MMSWKSAPWVAIDTETTGLEPGDGHAIVELATVLMQNGEVIERRAMLLNPRRPIPPEVSEVHHITDAMVADAETIETAGPRFTKYVEDHVRRGAVLVCYNAPFDLRFLEATVPGWSTGGLFVFDPLVVVRMDSVGRYWKGSGRHRLMNVADRLEVPMDRRSHRASADAEAAGRILWALRQHLPDDAMQAVELLRRESAKQQENYRAWKAEQPTQEGEQGS